MKKALLSMTLLSIPLLASAQVEFTLEAHSVYDVNKDNKITVNDVTTMVDKFANHPEMPDKKQVSTKSVVDMLSDMVFRLLDIENVMLSSPQLKGAASKFEAHIAKLKEEELAKKNTTKE